MVKFKDLITNVCGFVVTVGGAVLVSGLEIGEQVKLVIGLAVAVAGGVIGWLTGKGTSTSLSDPATKASDDRKGIF